VNSHAIGLSQPSASPGPGT